MTTAPAVSLRAAARSLSHDERKRRLATVRRASDAQLLRAVLSAGIGGGEWRSSAHCASDAFAIEPRTMRDWLANDYLALSRAIRAKLLDLAWQFGVEVRDAS